MLIMFHNDHVVCFGCLGILNSLLGDFVETDTDLEQNKLKSVKQDVNSDELGYVLKIVESNCIIMVCMSSIH